MGIICQQLKVNLSSYSIASTWDETKQGIELKIYSFLSSFKYWVFYYTLAHKSIHTNMCVYIYSQNHTGQMQWTKSPN